MAVIKNVIALFTLLILFSLTACKRPPLPAPVLLFDQGHGQQALIDNIRLDDLSKFAALFKEAGFQVSASRQVLSRDTLAKADSLIIAGPNRPLNNLELQEIGEFLQNGGQLCLLLANARSANNLLAALGVAAANMVVYEQQGVIATDPKKFRVKNLAKRHPLTKGIPEFKIYGAWPLNTALMANVIAKTSDKSWVDLNLDQQLTPGDAVQSFPVIVTGQVGHGHYVVFGDEALFRNRYLTENNLQLAKNLADWFKRGSYYR